jgi:hypothetical protein
MEFLRLNPEGKEHAQVDFIKVDCEGCEYPTFDFENPMVQNVLRNVKRISGELHTSTFANVTTATMPLASLEFTRMCQQINPSMITKVRSRGFIFIHQNSSTYTYQAPIPTLATSTHLFYLLARTPLLCESLSLSHLLE